MKMIECNADKLVKTMEKYFKCNSVRPIIASYLFGSYATGKTTKLSDIDIAVFLDSEVEKSSYFDIKLDLLADLSSSLGTDNVDLVILNEATPELAYSVIKEGILVYEEQEARGQLVSFKAKTFDRYFDYLPTKRIYAEALSARIREGRYGG